MNPIDNTLGSMRQRGISLATTLVMMVAVMVLGLSAMLISKGEAVLSGNLQFQAASLNEAEAAAITAEKLLASQGGPNVIANFPGFANYASGPGWQYPIGASFNARTMTWDDTNSFAVSDTQRYLIEFLAKDKSLIPVSLNVGGRAVTRCNKVNLFRIVAMGTKARGATRLVQSVYSTLSC